MEQYFVNYSSLEQQRWMVADRPRTDAFAMAIAEVVKPGDVVIDVGAGTGILSILAAKAGARRVIAVEYSDMANLASELIKHNGLENQIEVFHGNAHKLHLDEKADVIISEWLGHMAYVECMFSSVIHVRDAWLKPKGLLLPSSVDVMLAPIDDSESYHDYGPGFWQKSNIHGINFSCFTQKELQMGHATKLHVPSKFLLAPGKPINHLKTVEAQPGDEWCSGTVEYEIQRDGIVNGFAGWFNTQLSPSVLLDTAPHCPTTHWEQTYFPHYPMAVSAGQTIRVDYHMDTPFEGSRLMEMTLRMAEHEIKFVVE